MGILRAKVIDNDYTGPIFKHEFNSFFDSIVGGVSRGDNWPESGLPDNREHLEDPFAAPVLPSSFLA